MGKCGNCKCHNSDNDDDPKSIIRDLYDALNQWAEGRFTADIWGKTKPALSRAKAYLEKE